MGRHSYLSSGFTNYYYQKATVGNFSSVAAGVLLIPSWANHPCIENRDHVSTFPFKKVLGWDAPVTKEDPQVVPLSVGNDVWICHGAMIIGQVHIGDGAIIGAGAVIRHNVSPYDIVTGDDNVIGSRFPPEIVVRLLAQAWWHWPDEKIRENINKPLKDFLEVE